MRNRPGSAKLKTLGFVTYDGAQELTDDDRLVVEPLRRLGCDVTPLVWDDPRVEWSGHSALILRSTWDYHRKAKEFSSWLTRIESLAIPLWNPVELIRWNMDKAYLRELAADGVPVTPTEWLEAGEGANLAAVLHRRGWERAVVKPTLSATAFQTWVTTPSDARREQATLDDMTARGGVLIQQFEESIARGEWSLVFFRGQLSHAVLKLPRSGDFRVQKEYGGTSQPGDPPARLIEVAARALAQVRFPWLYARVDLVDSDSGVRLMELEMLEPDLFLRHSPGAAGRLAAAIHSTLPPDFSQA